MRKYTFPRYLKIYIRELSYGDTTSIHKLSDEASDNNYQLRAPLALYAICYDKTHLVLKFISNDELRKEYEDIFARYDKTAIEDALKSKSEDLSIEYHKVWYSYEYRRDHHEHDQAKELIRQEIKKLQKQKSISTFRICADIGIAQANMNTWLKHGNPNLISLKLAQNALDYMRKAEARN